MITQGHFHRIDNECYAYAEKWETNSWGKIGMLSTGVKIWASGVKLSLEDQSRKNVLGEEIAYEMSEKQDLFRKLLHVL